MLNYCFKAFSVGLLFVFSNLTYAACTQTDNKLGSLVGLDSQGGMVYANVSSVSNQCACSSVRFKPNNTDVKMALSVLLSAKMAEKEVRVDLLDEGDCNSAYRVYVE